MLLLIDMVPLLQLCGPSHGVLTVEEFLPEGLAGLVGERVISDVFNTFHRIQEPV